MSQGQGSASSAEESLVDSQSGQDKSVLNNSVTEQPADVNASSTNLSHNSISSDDDDLKSDSSSRVSVERKPVKNSSNEPSTRPVRTTSLSLKGKESKISSLNLDLGRKINSHIRYFNQIQLDMAEGITLDDLTTLSDEMNAEALVVSNMYNDLCRLCDNKPSAQIEKMFQFHDAAVSNFNELVEKQVQDLELQELEEVENSIQQANEEMEEETRLFEEYMNKMKQKPLQISLTAKEKVKAGQVISTRGSTEAKARSSREATASAPTQRSTNMLQTSGSTSYNEPFKDGSHPLPLKRSEQVSEVSSPLPTVHSERQELDAVKHLAESLAAAINCSKKSVEPSIFEGDVLQFSDWEVDLDTYLRTERIKGHERLRHLKKFINGEARKCIEGYFTTNTDDAYLAARAALKDRYGNEQTIARTFRRKLDAWPKVPPRDWKALTEFSDFLCHLNSAMVTIKPLKVLNDCVENEKILEKVPDWLRIKWAHIVAKAVRCEQRGDDRYPNFQEFSDFIKDEAYVMSLPISQAATPRIKDNKLKATRTYFSATTEREDACLFCNLKNHKTTDCRRLQDKSKEDKNKFVREKGLCFRCFSSGHRSKGCKATLTCNICHKHHASANHDLNWNEHREKKLDRAGEKPESKPTSKKEPPTKVKETKPLQHEKAVTDISVKATSTLNELSVRGIRTRQGLTSMAIPVYVSAGTGAEMLVYALLDNQSDACFISRDVIRTLKPKVTEVEPVKICTLNGEKETDLNRYDSIRLRGYSTDYHTVISVFEQPKIALDREQLPTPEKAEKVNHLRSIANQMPPLLDIPIGLLLGMNYPELIQPLEIKPAPDNAPGKPFGVRTTFGWTMCGGSSSSRAARNKTVFKINLKSDTEILRVLERDFQDIEQDKSMSQEDIKFLQTLESGTIQSQQGNYILPLPFKRNPDLPNNRSQAEKRLTLLMKKLQADKGYSQEYVKFMNDLILAGHAEQVPQDELAKHVGVWYLPHFGVRHPQKKKLRVVFDASARFKGAALNDFLHTGPDHMNSLLGILLRFRREPIAFTCDIQQMFHNFLVTPQHRDYLRFLWTNDDPKIIQEFRMKVHLFGATSSPGVATFGLRKVAEDYRNISTEATRFLKDDFYVDDGVTSVSTPQEAKELIKAATTICTKANIRLHKFTCNNEEVLSTVPISERKEVSKSIDIFKDSLYCERTLGMEWNICSDTFHYTTPTSAKPATRRGILSTIARIYDPIGFVSPIVLKGKQILQQITMANQSWDQLLNPSVKLEWDKWYAGLSNLPLLKIKRCFKPSEEVKVTELHHYSDASLQGYGACSYLRQITKDGKVSCSLLLAKARVTPLKTQTIPRLELQGAVIATRLATTLRKELKIKIDSEFFWTDSKITLGYIANDAKRFHMFVANRVQEIKQTTTPQQWHHVLSNDNPADLVSRGATVLELSQKSIWFDGPTYLQQTDITDYIVKTSTERKVDEKDPEVRKLAAFSTKTTTKVKLTYRFAKFSNWKSLIRSIALLKNCAKAKSWKITKPSLANLNDAENFIIKKVQQEKFLKMEKDKTLVKLNPVLDENGMIRIGGRAERASGLHHLQKHPLIIPKASHIGHLLSKHYHEKIYHLGQRSTLAMIRDAGFWILNGTGQVKSLIRKCVGCARLRKPPQSQLMGQLPKERVEQTPPFTHVGMDVFGHFNVRDRRTELKRWGLLLTCMYSRAIHIELLEDLSSDALINALRCFMAVRGPVNTIHCDNGTNFVGAKNELYRHSQIANRELQNYLEDNSITFKFNSPDASHQGGSWERLIRSVRAVLNGMSLKYSKRLDSQTLRTAFFEAASIINSRPITAMGINNPEEHILTPNHLLTMKTKQLLAPPPGNFSPDEIYGRKRWKMAQQFAEEFWTIWKAEYLQQMQIRQKWTNIQRNIKTEDIVLVKDENAPRCDWRVGIITDTISDADGLVRNVKVRLGNKYLDKTGRPLEPPVTLSRPIQKIVLLEFN